MNFLKQRTLGKLEATRAFPCISILMRTHKGPLGFRSDRIELKKLLAELDERLGRSCPVKKARRLAAKIRELVSKVDLGKLDQDLCLFVADDVEAVQLVRCASESRVVVGEEFALRDILLDVESRVHVVMVVVSDDRVRVLSNLDGVFSELSGDFVLRRKDSPGATERVVSSALANNTWIPGRTRGPSGRAPLPGAYTADEDSVELEHCKQFFRTVNGALSDVLSANTKIVLTGAAHQTALFEELCSHKEKIIARVEGNFVKHSDGELRQTAKEQLEKFERASTQSALRNLCNHSFSSNVAFGIEEVWQVAQQKPIAELLIDERFRYPAIVDREHLIIERAEGSSFDATEELVKMAHSAGAKIVPCRNRELEDYGHIAARFSF